MEDFAGGLIVETFSGSVVELGGGPGQIVTADAVEVGSLGTVLPQQTVGMFVRAALPGFAWLGEEHRQSAFA